MGSESKANEAEGRMGYWLRGREIVLVKPSYLVKNIETRQL